MCSSFQMPKSAGVMRASGLTAAASVMTRPAPPTARLPRWTRCQSLAKPSVEEYSHMGETAMRLGMVRARRVRGAKRRFWDSVGRLLRIGFPGVGIGTADFFGVVILW